MISYKTTLSGSAPNSPSPFPFNLQLHFSLPIIYTSLRGTCLTWNLATHMFYSVMDTSLNICLVHSLPLGLCSFIVTSEASLTTQYKNRITPFSNSNRITRFAVETGDGWHSAIFESQMNSKQFSFQYIDLNITEGILILKIIPKYCIGHTQTKNYVYLKFSFYCLIFYLTSLNPP